MPADQLQPISIVAPGFAGLNTEESSVSVPKEFALRAENCVIDKFGRIGSRKGWVPVNEEAFTGEPGVIHEYVSNTGDKIVYYVVDGVIYSIDMDTGVSTEEYTIASAPADDYWQAINFNNHVYMFHDDAAPIINHVDHTGWELVSSHSLLPTSVTTVGCATAAYGRMWIARTNVDKTTLYWSDLLIGYDFQGGTSSNLSIEKTLTNGTDEITAIAAFNGYLIVFCTKSVLVYSGADNDPTSNLALVEAIDGVGCIARDSIQDIGTDILFLSDTGVRSLSRIIQEKSAPIFDVSKNVRSDLISDVLINNNPASVRSVYNEKEAFYLLTLVDRDITYVFDTRAKLQDGSLRITNWTLSPKAYCSLRNRDLLISRNGYIAKYEGNNDNGTAFRLAYYTSYLDAGNPSVIKILKKSSFLLIGGSETKVIMYWAGDYSSNYFSGQIVLDRIVISNFGESEYNVDEFAQGTIINNLRQQFSGAGRVFQVGLEAEISTDSLSIQQMDFFVKIGRTV